MTLVVWIEGGKVAPVEATGVFCGVDIVMVINSVLINV